VTNKYSAAMQQLIVYAQQEAMKREETQLSTAHLLLGITVDPYCTAAQALACLGVSLEKLWNEIHTKIPPCPPDDNPDFHMSPEGKQAINDALYVSRTMGDGTILTIHVLMGIYSQVGAYPAGNVAGQLRTTRTTTPSEILASLGVTRERLWRIASDYHRGNVQFATIES